MLKTRVAHGHCSRNVAAEACVYANICDNFATTAELAPANTSRPHSTCSKRAHHRNTLVDHWVSN